MMSAVACPVGLFGGGWLNAVVVRGGGPYPHGFNLIDNNTRSKFSHTANSPTHTESAQGGRRVDSNNNRGLFVLVLLLVVLS